MPVSSNYRNIKNKESLVYVFLIKSFRKVSFFLKENVKDLYINHVYDTCVEYDNLSSNFSLYPKKSANSGIEGFWRSLGIYDMIDFIGKQAEKTCIKGCRRRTRLFEDIIKETGIVVNNNIGKDYLKIRKDLELSNYKGTITHTTKFNIISILKNGIDNHLSVGEIQKEIVSLNSKLFSKARARSIAVTEIGKAYEYGNYKCSPRFSNYSLNFEEKGPKFS